ncbi:MAG TPA: sugar transferase, partial [Bryobacteraceae bacterium]|nr:sugar transferase [Bryobacteraceae bacterium]
MFESTNGVAAEKIASQSHSIGADVLEERLFSRMLYLERKRTERSGTRLVLMLLESKLLVRVARDSGRLETIVNTLSRSLRETDIKGWYEEGVLGVIFTEIGPAEGKTIASALLNRVTRALCSELSIEEINQIHISFHVFPDMEGRHKEYVEPDLTFYPDQRTEPDNRSMARAVKRAIDIIGSSLAIAILSPLFVLIAVLIKLTSPGPVFFRQERLGLHGVKFTFLKFRSMYISCDDKIHREYVERLIEGKAHAQSTPQGSSEVFKLTNDPRVTPIGKILRRTSFDELPQFFNVLCGDMSLVGPRPPVQYECVRYAPWHKRRLMAVKPGI